MLWAKVSKNVKSAYHLTHTVFMKCSALNDFSLIRAGRFFQDGVLNYTSSCPEVVWRKGVLEICSKFTGEHQCRWVISIKLLCNFIEIPLWHGCSTVNLLYIFSKNLFLITPLYGCFWNYKMVKSSFSSVSIYLLFNGNSLPIYVLM